MVHDRSSIWLLVLANALLPIAILTFAVGFFPHKPFIPGFNEHESLDYQGESNPPFDKVVFMVVDALRRSDHFRFQLPSQAEKMKRLRIL